MVVELIGGPLDGAIIGGPSHMPAYMIVSSHQEGPIYRAGRCDCCAGDKQIVPYYFLGYEEPIRYEYPEKLQGIALIDQVNTYLADS